MQVCKNSNALVNLIAAALFMVSTATYADFRVVDIQATFDESRLILSGSMDLVLSRKVEEAVAKGIPLEVEIEFRLMRERKMLWSKQLARWKIRRHIRYHALSGQYFVNNPTAKSKRERLDNFISLQQALRHMGTLTEITLDAPAERTVGTSYLLDARVSLDIESLPAPLRPVAYTSLDWRLNSGWTSWTVNH